jgi:Cof subfamily protein (haloacid dehalogenase superfamily)
MNDLRRTTPQKISLLVSDVDGTLVTKEKVLTSRACAAARRLRDAGIAFALTSGRPPRGMQMLIEPLNLTGPIAAFNGGVFVRPDMSIIEQHFLPADVARRVVESLESHGLDVWVYDDTAWYVRARHGPHVDREEWTVKFPPTVVTAFDDACDRTVKIVGVSDDHLSVARVEMDVQRKFGAEISAARSQPYYLDVTHPKANKGTVIEFLSRVLEIPTAEIATIGDGPNDVLMFEKSGMSIAVGNASQEVRHAAQFVSSSSENEGFANAVDRFVLANH